MLDKTTLERVKSREHIEEAYDLIAHRYANQWFSKPASPILDKFIGNIAPMSVVLDVGCGPGGHVRYFIDHGVNAFGIDTSSRMLQEALGRCQFNRFIRMNMLEMGIRSNVFDGLWVCSSLVHIPEEQVSLALTEFRRVLKQGGVLFVSVTQGSHNRIESPAEFDRGGKYGRFFQCYRSRSHFEQYLDSAGFVVIDYTEHRVKSDVLPKSQVREVYWMEFYAR